MPAEIWTWWWITLVEDILPEEIGRIGGNDMDLPGARHAGKHAKGMGTDPGELDTGVAKDNVSFRLGVCLGKEIQHYRGVPAPAE